MAVSLLKYANREAVAQALTEQGYSVSRQTVNRWARGDEMPTIAARMIGELFGHAAGHTSAAPPGWARRLLVDVEALGRRAQLTDEELAEALVALVRDGVVDETLLQQGAGGGAIEG